MTNTDTLRSRALAALSAPHCAYRAHEERDFWYATVEVTLPDGSTGHVKAIDLAGATGAMACQDWRLQVQQGQRVDLWHVSQLA